MKLKVPILFNQMRPTISLLIKMAWMWNEFSLIYIPVKLMNSKFEQFFEDVNEKAFWCMCLGETFPLIVECVAYPNAHKYKLKYNFIKAFSLLRFDWQA